ncbi:transposase [Methylosinus sp. KRF6]|uniref:transposase n=1 Tax=Methylosinus sp. KRF6 TaxID=2846853 RepID=UPI001C0C8F4F|nr:transposase [Methylosinus sp. KRF6]
MRSTFDTGGIVAAPIHEADKGDTTTLGDTLETAKANLTAVGLAPTPDDPCEIIADKGYHSHEVLKGLDDGEWKSRISEPSPAKGYLGTVRNLVCGAIVEPQEASSSIPSFSHPTASTAAVTLFSESAAWKRSMSAVKSFSGMLGIAS